MSLMNDSIAWTPKKATGEFMTKGRRTNVFIQNDVAIDDDGMENLDDFWGAAGQANISMGSPSILFEQTPPPSPSFQNDTFQTPSPRKSPSAISLSPSSAMTPIAVPEKRITIETPSKTPERATEQEIPRMNRLRNSPMPETSDLMKAVNDARAVSNVKLPVVTPARPVQKPVLRPQVQPQPQVSAPKEETPVRRAPQRFDVPEVRFDFQTPEVFKRLDRELASVPEPTYDVRPTFGRVSRFDEAPAGDWRVWRPPEEVERPSRPVFDDIVPERVVPERKPDEVDELVSFSEPKAFGTGEARRPRLDKDYEFGSYGTGPIFAPFKREPAKPAGEKRMHFDRVPNLSSDSDSDLDLGPEPVRPRRTGRVALEVEPLNPEPVRANRIERLSRARQSPAASKYLEPVRLNPFGDDSDSSEPDASEMGGVSNMGRTGSVLKQRPMEEDIPLKGGKREPMGSFAKKQNRPQFEDESPPRGTAMGGSFFGNRSRPHQEQFSDGDAHVEPTGSIFKNQDLQETGGEEPPGDNKFFGILRRTVNVGSQVSRGHTPMKNFGGFSGTEQNSQQKGPKIDSIAQVDIPPEERPIRYVFGGHDSDSEQDEIHFEQKYESIRPELPTMSNFNFHMGMASTHDASPVSSSVTQPKAPKSVFQGTMPATPKFEVEEHRRHRRHRRSSGGSENQPPVTEESPAVKPTYLNPSMMTDPSENQPTSGDHSPEFLRRSPSPVHPAYSIFEQGVGFGDGDSDQYEKMVADVDSPPPMPSDGEETGGPDSDVAQPAPIKAEEPRRRRAPRQKRQPRPAVDYSQMDDLDRPIALRRTKRPHTKPLKYWKGEKIIYQCDENGFYTQQGVHRVSDDEDDVPAKSRRTRRTSRKPIEKEIEVLPARVLPGEADEQKIKYTGLANKAMVTDEYEILPRRSMVFKAVKQRMILHVSHGKAKLHAHDKKWVIGAGGMIYITRGDSCRITNRSTTEPVRLFETSM